MKNINSGVQARNFRLINFAILNVPKRQISRFTVKIAKICDYNMKDLILADDPNYDVSITVIQENLATLSNYCTFKANLVKILFRY